MQEHRVLVACEALWADRALRRALLRQPPKAGENEPAPLEEIRHQGERENATQTEPPRLRDAGEHELPADPAARRLWTRGERAFRPDLVDRARLEASVVSPQLFDRDSAEVLSGREALADDAPDDLVRFAKRHAALGEVIGEVRGPEHAPLGRTPHRLPVETKTADDECQHRERISQG